MSSRVGWNTLIERRPWLARVMLAICASSLLATSPDDGGDYDDYGSVPFRRTSSAPDCVLTAETPVCDYVVSVRHDVPDPGEPFFTYQARASVHGTVVLSNVTGDAPFLGVKVSDDQSGVSELNAVTEFTVTRSLTFSGGCAEGTTETPCISEFRVSFRRSDLGERGGSVNVHWDILFEARSISEVGAGADEMLPWTVEYTPQ